jgi:hypothetical protein
MKTLNGKTYFEKKDVKEVLILALSVVDNPYDDQDFLLSILEDEKTLVRHAIKALGNSITWEFSSETAVSYKRIVEIDKTMRFPVMEVCSYDELKALPLDKVSKLTMQHYENWLQHVGLDITLNEFQKVTSQQSV